METPQILYLNRELIAEISGHRSELFVESVEQALILHASGEYVQPLKPYLRTKSKDRHIADRIIAMPAHIGGERPVSGMKWIGSKHSNPALKGMERASGLILLNDPETNYPVAVLEAGLISSMRTAAVTAVAARYLAREGFRSVTCIGCGLIANAQLKTMLEHFTSIESIYLYDMNDASAAKLQDQLLTMFPEVKVCIEGSAENAIRQGEVIITCTVTDTPYIRYEWLRKGAFISNISTMDVTKEVFLQADKVIVDDWDQSNREKKILNQLVEEGLFSREKLHAELGEIVAGNVPGRESEDEIILLNPMGMAIEDIACARSIYDKAVETGQGTVWNLY